MSVTIVATAGAVDANSYCTLAEAETYFESRLHKDDWTSASDDTKNAALVWATQLLDDLVDWVGGKYTESQALRWPRWAVYDQDGYVVSWTSIPQFLKDATAELAMHLINNDIVTDDGTKGFSELRADTIMMKIDKYDRKSIIPRSVWVLLKDYGNISGYKKRFCQLVRC
jgi:hypothetical protein